MRAAKFQFETWELIQNECQHQIVNLQAAVIFAKIFFLEAGKHSTVIESS